MVSAAPFIVLEGGEGCGKTTQLHHLATAFEAASIPYIATREPGGIETAEAIRHVILSSFDTPLEPVSELLLFNAARAEHWYKKVLPARAEGRAILCDRFIASTLVYQGLARGLGSDYVALLHTLLFANTLPDFTLLLDIAPALSQQRLSGRAEANRFDTASEDFHAAVRQGFLQLAEKNPDTYAVIDAAQTEQQVHQQVVEAVNNVFDLKLLPIML